MGFSNPPAKSPLSERCPGCGVFPLYPHPITCIVLNDQLAREGEAKRNGQGEGRTGRLA